MKNLLIILTLVLFTSCVTQKRCAEKFPPSTHIQNVVTETITDTIIQQISVTDTISITEIKEIPIDRWFTITDTSGVAELKIMKNKLGELIIECTKKDQLIENHEKTIHTLKSSDQVRTITNTPKWAWWLLAVNAVIVSFKLAQAYFKFNFKLF